jgi:hypothetical protein
VLPEGVTPTTDRINLLRWGPEVSEHAREAYLLERTHPAELLRELNIVDTPGTNAVVRRHEELTRDFVPRSDLVLFVTSADRPFTESERQFLEQIRAWGKKIVLIINKADILATAGELEQVTTSWRRTRHHAARPRAGDLRGLGAAGAAGARRRNATRRSGSRAASSASRSTCCARSTRRSASGSSCSTR